MDNIAIIVAAGSGTRAKSQLPKQFEKLGVQTVLDWSVQYFYSDIRFSKTIIVHAKDAIDLVIGSISIENPLVDDKLIFIEGGTTRTESTRTGLIAALKYTPKAIFIHDAARPGINKQTIDDLLEKIADGSDGALPALSVSDALWQIDSNDELTQPIQRKNVRRVQTPQAFVFEKLLAAYSNIPEGVSYNDDAEVAMASGMNISIVEGSLTLDKITFQEDFKRMEHLLMPNQNKIRVGSGFDAHKFGTGEFITLCGEKIPHSNGLLGHSDADVAWHALVDAILGALGEGDIGTAFPPSDPQWKGAASSVFLEYAVQRVKERGGTINHLDLTIICESPKIGPHRDKLIQNTCRIANLDRNSVSIKATTTEAMGFTGRKEGIAAQAIATITI